MNTDWRPSPIPGVQIVKKDNGRLLVTSSRDDHFYIPAGRDDTNFRLPPEESSLDPLTGGSVIVSADVECLGDIRPQMALVEYTESGDRVLIANTSSVEYHPSDSVTAVSLAMRFQGRGTVLLQAIAVMPSRSRPVRATTETVELDDADTAVIRFSAYSVPSGASDSALLAFTFRDTNGEIVPPSSDRPIHPELGAYSYISCGSNETPTKTALEIEVPPEARVLEIAGHSWKTDAECFLSDSISVELRQAESVSAIEDIETFVASIPDDETLIVMYTTAPLMSHETLSLRPNRLTREYLDLGHWVVFFPFSRVPAGSEFVQDRCRQYSLSDLHRFLDAASCRRGPQNIFVCSSFPDLNAVSAIDLLKSSSWRTVYEVRDDMEEFNRVGYSKWFHTQLESRVASASDLVVAVSPRLAEKMNIVVQNEKAIVVPNGVAADFVYQSRHLRTTTSFRRRAESRTVGYIGHLTPSWFDWSLLIAAAEAMPEVKFEIIGHGAPDSLSVPANLILLGPRTHNEFLEIVEEWKVGIIPFKPSTLTTAVDPNKIYEYLAAGLRVVSARMGSIKEYPSTWVYDSGAEFSSFIVDALNRPFEELEIQTFSEFALRSTWSARAQSMLELMRNSS